MTLPPLDMLIAAAQERRAAAEADVARMREQRQHERLAAFEQELRELFGEAFLDLLDCFDCSIDASDYETRPIARFFYHDRSYALREGRSGMLLTRWSPREEGDERPLPHDDFYAHWQDGQERNQDRFLLALAGLDRYEESPRSLSVRADEPPPPTVEQRLIDALRELIAESSQS